MPSLPAPAASNLCSSLFLQPQIGSAAYNSFVLAESKPWLREVNLHEELGLSELSREAIELIEKKSKGVMSIGEFLLQSEKIRPKFRLGLDYYHFAWGAIKKLIPSLVTDAYKYFDVSPGNPDHSRLITDRMSNSGQTIIFFVPRSVLNHHQRNATANELEHLLGDLSGKRMKNVIFVFGAYDVMTDAGYWNLGLAFPEGSANFEAQRANFIATVYMQLKENERR